MKPALTLLTALLLAPLISLHAADKPAKPNPDQFAGVDPDDGNAKFDATAQQAMKFQHTDTPDGVVIEFHLTDEAFAQLPRCDLITSARLGEFPLVKQRMEDRDGKPYDLDTDIAGQPREHQAGAAVPGPFAKLAKGKNAFRFSAGASASSFVSKP